MNTTCPTRIYSDGWLRGDCGKTAKHEHDGVMYCKLHHPPTVKAKNEARQTAFKQKWDAEHAARIKASADRKEQERRAECFPDLLEALQKIILMDGTETNEWDAVDRLLPEIMQIARAAIAKATGETA